MVTLSISCVCQNATWSLWAYRVPPPLSAHSLPLPLSALKPAPWTCDKAKLSYQLPNGATVAARRHIHRRNLPGLLKLVWERPLGQYEELLNISCPLLWFPWSERVPSACSNVGNVSMYPISQTTLRRPEKGTSENVPQQIQGDQFLGQLQIIACGKSSPCRDLEPTQTNKGLSGTTRGH